MPFHERKQRWACLVCHRRLGKTVGVVNEVIKRALEKKGNYAYIAPFRSQAKTVAWDYFKFYASNVIKPKTANEAELKLTLINGSTIQLFGADNADAMRGLGFDGVACDEYGDFRPSVWGNVIRPTLSDKKGWAVFMGTPKGHNQFYDVYRNALNDPSWFVLVIKASESKWLDDEELRDARKQLSQDQYDQEYECSFDAAILGAYYGREMAAVDREGRIRAVEHDPAYVVNTAWDIGRTDDTAIWFYQNVGNEIHVLDYFAESGGSIEEFTGEVFVAGSLTRAVVTRAKERGYRYGRHWLPHDARAKTLASDGKSVVEKLGKYLGISSLYIAPSLSIEDGIQAARTALNRCWFDEKCNVDTSSGVECLRQYQREYNEDKKAFGKAPLHNWASHGADAFRMLAVAERRARVDQVNHMLPNKPIELKGLNTMTLDELWAEKEANDERMVRI